MNQFSPVQKAWALFHALGTTAWIATAIYTPSLAELVFRVYLASFLALEGAGLYYGEPMTVSVWRAIKATKKDAKWGSIVAFSLGVWIGSFSIGATLFGPFSPPVNAFICIIILPTWMTGHFYGNRWG